MPIVDYTSDEFIRNNFGAQLYRITPTTGGAYADGDQVSGANQIDVAASVNQVLILKQISLSSTSELDEDTASYDFLFFDRDPSGYLDGDQETLDISAPAYNSMIGMATYDPTATGVLNLQVGGMYWASTGEITVPLVETGNGLWMVMRVRGSSSVNITNGTLEVQLAFL